MTTPDIAGLCERLEAMREWHDRTRDRETITLSKAALERQAAQIERLRSDVDFAVSCLCSLRKNYADGLGIWDDVDKAISARAALTGKDA